MSDDSRNIGKSIKPVTVNVCGRDVTVLNPKVDMILFMALASLNDERVNNILRAFDLEMKDINGVTFWPPDRAGQVKHAKVSQLFDDNKLNGDGS